MVERLVRNRGSIGRRIWRRRRRKSNPDGAAPAGARPTGASGEASTAAHKPGDAWSKAGPPGSPSRARKEQPQDKPGSKTADSPRQDLREDTVEHDGTDPGDVDDGRHLSRPPGVDGQEAPREGLFARLKGLFRSRAQTEHSSEDAAAEDIARAVLAVPRGVARLDAFERAVVDADPQTSAFRPLALAFHKELRFLADSAAVDLALLDRRVECCARALIAAGEDELAGNLLLRVGRRHQAAELFVSAGAVDALEETYAQIRWEEGGARHDARLAFERFESLFLVHMREAALLALERAYQLWSDNPVYAEVRQAFHARLTTPWRVALSSGRSVVRVIGQWPVVIGRGEDAGVRLSSPLLSRAHLQLERDGDVPVLVDPERRGTARVEGEAFTLRRALPDGEVDVDMNGVVLRAHRAQGSVALWPAHAPDDKTIVPIHPPVRLPETTDGTEGVRIGFDARGRACVEPPALLGDDALKRSTLLLVGDKVALPGSTRRWTVTKA